MGSQFSSSRIKMSTQGTDKALSKAKGLVSSTPVIVFSKMYCGYCNRVKQLLTQLGATFKDIELDKESDGQEIQSALYQWTGLKTVPNVFIGGKHIGEVATVRSMFLTATLAKYQQGELMTLLNKAGAMKSAYSAQTA